MLSCRPSGGSSLGGYSCIPERLPGCAAKWLNAVSGEALMIFGLDCGKPKEALIEMDCAIMASLCINSG